MHGNVWEWCRDVLDEDAYKRRADGIENPQTEAKDESSRGAADRVVRGGSWIFGAGFARSAARAAIHPGVRGRALGFRVCLFPGPSESQGTE